MTVTADELFDQAVLLLKEGKHSEATSIFKQSIDSFSVSDVVSINTQIKKIAIAYDNAIDKAQPLAPQHSLVLESMREIFPKGFVHTDIFIALTLYNLYNIQSLDLNSSNPLKSLSDLNEAISLIYKYPEAADMLRNISEPILKGIEVTCDKLYNITIASVDPQEKSEIFNNIVSSIQNAFPQGHEKLELYKSAQSTLLAASSTSSIGDEDIAISTIDKAITEATSLLKSGNYIQAKEIFKSSMNTKLETGDNTSINKIILDIAIAYENAAKTQTDALSYSLNALASMREIFPQNYSQTNAQIAVLLHNIYMNYPKDSSSATQLELLDHLNEGLSLATKVINVNNDLLSGLRTRIEATCDNLFEFALSSSVNFQEQFFIYSNISSSIQTAFPEGHPKTGHYIANLGITYLNLKDLNNGLLNLYKAIDISNNTNIIEGATTQICQSTKALFHDTKILLPQKIAISDYMSEHLSSKDTNALGCIVFIKSSLALEYTKSAIIEWNQIMPSLTNDLQQAIQTKIDSSCISLGFGTTEDCITKVIGVTLDLTEVTTAN